MALYYEDILVGETFTTPARTITEHDIISFAGLSGDYNPLHTDYEYCKSTIFGKPIAHGLLGLAVTGGLVSRLDLTGDTTIAFLGLDWKFTAPIFINDTIRAEVKIESKRETSRPDRGLIVRSIKLFNQRNEVVQKGSQSIMVKRKPLS